MNIAGQRPGRWARLRASARVLLNAAVGLIVLALLGGLLTFGTSGILYVAIWLVLATTFTAVGAVLASRVPENAFGWVLLSIGATSALTVSTASSDVPGILAWLRSWMIWVPVGLLPVALLLFPTGRPPSARWRWVLALAVGGAALPTFFLAVASAITPDPLGVFGGLTGLAGSSVDRLLFVAELGMLMAGIALLLGVVSLLTRLRLASDIERRQVLCLIIGASALALGLALEYAGLIGAGAVGAAGLPIAAGVAILWHRLYDLDLFINRSLVYVGLSSALIAAFAAIVLLGNLVAASLLPDGAWTLIAVASVALGVDPLRRRLQRAVDHLLYGDRNDPYAVVTAVGRELGSSKDAPTMLAEVAEAIARSLALPYVAIEARSPDGAPPELTEWGRCHGQTIGLALTRGGEQIGRLLVTPRTVGGTLSERDRGLLDDIAQPVALTVGAVELSAGLQRAREQLVTTREEERRRLRRDLHDGLGPTLAGMVMQLDAACNVLRRDASAVEPLLAGLRTSAQDAVADIRRLVYELRPPALDELGLVGAIRAWTDRLSSGAGDGALAVSLEAPAVLPSLPAAVEVAALRIAQEAITNVMRHAQARRCRVRITVDGALCIRIEDDGRGLPDDLRAGVGIGSMRERAAEVGGRCTVTSPSGGGTHVDAVLPLPSP